MGKLHLVGGQILHGQISSMVIGNKKLWNIIDNMLVEYVAVAPTFILLVGITQYVRSKHQNFLQLRSLRYLLTLFEITKF